MELSQLKIGMILVNTGMAAIPLYHDETASGDVALTIQPGEVIGQIVDFSSGIGGPTIVFVDHSELYAFKETTGPITDSGRFGQKVLSYSLSWLLDPVKISATARFKDIQANVSNDQVQDQNTALANAAANGVSFGNMIKKGVVSAAETVSETIQSSVPWGLVGAAGLAYVLLNWNTFFKSKQL